jgi:diguanylate cyclase (GGDEF)-like protein
MIEENLGKPLALIVEDDADISRLYESVLQQEDFCTEVIASGEVVLIRLQEIIPDLILLDMRLAAGVIGNDILVAIKEDLRLEKTRVIVITAYAHMIEELQNEVDLVLLKPIQVSLLKGILARIYPTVDERGNEIVNRLAKLVGRQAMRDKVEENIARLSNRREYIFGIIYLEILNLAEINQQYGDKEVDKLLVEIAQWLQSCVRSRDPMTYIGDGRFAVVLENLKKPENTYAISERIRMCCEDKITQKYADMPITFQVKTLSKVDKHDSAEELLFTAKDLKRN